MAGRRERRAANRAPLPRSAPDPTNRSTPSAGSAMRSAGRAALPCDRQIPTVPNRDAPCPAPNSPAKFADSATSAKSSRCGRGCRPPDHSPGEAGEGYANGDNAAMSLDRAINIEDLHRMAKRKLPRIIFDYIEGGVEDERGTARNEAAFHKHKLLPRYLVDVSKRDQSTTVFGRTYASPFGISPTGGVGLYRR